MTERWRFWRNAGLSGLRWLGGVTDHIGRGLTVLAFFGVPAISIAALHGGVWALAAGVGALALLTLGEGCYRLWRDIDESLRALQLEPTQAAQLRQWRLESLGRRRTLGQYLFADIDRIDVSDLDDYFRVNTLVHEWTRGTHDELAKESWTLVSLFESDVGLPDKYDEIETSGIDGYAANLRRLLS